MVQPLSDDLRRRMVAAVDGGMSRRGAAKRFGIAPSTAIEWVRAWRRTVSCRPGPQGGDDRSQRIEARAAAVLALAEEAPDMTLAKIAAICRAGTGCGSPRTRCGASSTAAITFEKPLTPASGNDLTCCGAGAPGSKPGPISTPESSSSLTLRRTVAEGRVSRRAGLPPRWRGAQAGLCAAIGAGRRCPTGTGRLRPSSAP